MTRRAGRRLALVAAVACVLLAVAVFVYGFGPPDQRRVSGIRWARAAAKPLTRRQVEDFLGGPGRAAGFVPRTDDPAVVTLSLDTAPGFRQDYTAAWASDPSRECRIWLGTDSYYLVVFEHGVARHWSEHGPLRRERADWLTRQLERFDR